VAVIQVRPFFIFSFDSVWFFGFRFFAVASYLSFSSPRRPPAPPCLARSGITVPLTKGGITPTHTQALTNAPHPLEKYHRPPTADKKKKKT